MGQSDYDYLLDVSKRYLHGEISLERYKEVWDMIMRWKREEQGGNIDIKYSSYNRCSYVVKEQIVWRSAVSVLAFGVWLLAFGGQLLAKFGGPGPVHSFP